MKRSLAFCILSLLAVHAEDVSAEIKSPQRIGQAQWCLKVSTGDRSIWLTREDPLRSPLAPPESTADERQLAPRVISPRTWPVTRASLAQVVSGLNKYLEWAAVAKKNAVKDFQKQIEPFAAGDILGMKFLVSAGMSTVWVQKEDAQNSFQLTESDATAVLALLTKLPELDTSLIEKSKRSKDQIGTLFK